MPCVRPLSLEVMDYKETIRMLEAENAKLRNALQSIANISLMDTGHWAKTIEAEALAALNGEKK